MKESQGRLGWHRRLAWCYFPFAIITLLSVWFFMFSPQTSALTTVPTKMNFQGRLTDTAGNIKPNGTYNMKLKLYTVDTGGSSVWSEDRLVSATQGVTVTNGLFSIQLGSITSLPANLFASGALYLEVELPTPASATTSSPVWTEGAMTPRNQMATSAYAYNSETLDGLDSVDFAQIGANNTFTGTNAFNGTTFSIAGTANASKFNVGSIFNVDTSGSKVSIGASDTVGTVLVLDTKTDAGDPTGVDGAMYYNSSSKSFRCYQNGAWRSCIGGLVASNTSIPAGNTITAATSNGSEILFSSNYAIPAGDCQPGKVYRVTARGQYSTSAITSPTLTLAVKLGGTAIGTTGNATSAGMSNRLWAINFNITCFTIGASGTVEGLGVHRRFTSVTNEADSEMNTGTTTFDNSGSMTLQVGATWSSNAANNSVTLRQFIVESLGPS
jgi:hypothetical protein